MPLNSGILRFGESAGAIGCLPNRTPAAQPPVSLAITINSKTTNTQGLRHAPGQQLQALQIDALPAIHACQVVVVEQWEVFGLDAGLMQHGQVLKLLESSII